ncbi:MAG: tetratricopeptide repeat protein [Pseudodesulfovibrio sp.]|nr:tetratricopeptide repeat protein [Pseudodesulfovibrio sp.]
MAENNTPQQAVLEEVEAQAPQSMHPILEAAFKYQKQLIITVVAIITAAAIYAGINAYNTKAEVTAQANLGTILIEATGQEKIKRLEELLGMVPSSVTPAVQLELAQSCMTLGEYDKAADYWNQLVGNTDNDMQIVARLGKAKSLLLGGKTTEAFTELKDLAGIAPESFIIPVYRQLALTAELTGNTDEALNAYRTLSEKQISDKPFIDYKISQLEAK